MVRVWSRVMVGIEATEMSAQFFIEYTGKGGGLKQLRSDQKHGGQYLRFRKGRPLSDLISESGTGSNWSRNSTNGNWTRSTSKAQDSPPLHTRVQHHGLRKPCDGNHIYGPDLQIQQTDPQHSHTTLQRHCDLATTHRNQSHNRI